MHSFWVCIAKVEQFPKQKTICQDPKRPVYHYVNWEKHKKLDFNLLQNRNPIVVYGVVYTKTRETASILRFFLPIIAVKIVQQAILPHH